MSQTVHNVFTLTGSTEPLLLSLLISLSWSLLSSWSLFLLWSLSYSFSFSSSLSSSSSPSAMRWWWWLLFRFSNWYLCLLINFKTAKSYACICSSLLSFGFRLRSVQKNLAKLVYVHVLLALIVDDILYFIAQHTHNRSACYDDVHGLNNDLHSHVSELHSV